MATRRNKYPNGTVLKNTAKAIRLHDNHFSADDRYRVTGPAAADWFKAVAWTDRFSGRRYRAGEVIDRNIRVVHDSYVEPA